MPPPGASFTVMSTTSYETLNPAPRRSAMPAWLAAVAGDGAVATVIEMPRALTASAGRPDHDTILQAYNAYRRELLRFATLVAPQDGVAEDLVQEAFVRLYKSWSKVDDQSKVAGYLRVTVLNLARGRGRRLGVARRHRQAALPDVASAEAHALDRIGADALVAALRELPRRQRECLVLRYFEGCGESEIAEALGISVGSARTHVHRGTRSLRKLLGEEAS